ncbi:MAG TPA: hypothetical protein DEF42_03535 [Desulfosporosinus sp.]|nr:hypothetical protein [Desulfosporosinus sp.]
MFQITLRTARESCGYSESEVAAHCGITIKALKKYERNSALIPVEVINKLNLLYSVPLVLIFIGTEAKCVMSNRKNAKKK